MPDTTRTRSWDDAHLAASWADAADALDEVQVAVALGPVADDVRDAARRARAELLAGRVDDAARTLRHAGLDAHPEGTTVSWDEVVALAVRAAQGDDRARVAVLGLAHRVEGPDRVPLLYLVGAVGERCGLTDVATEAWQRLAQATPTTTYVLSRACAGALRARRRIAAGTFMEAASVLCDDVDQDVAVARVRATVRLLTDAGDRTGAALLLAAVRRRLPDPRVAQMRAATGVRARWAAVAAGSLGALALGALGAWGLLTGGLPDERTPSVCLFVVVALAAPLLTPVPGASRADGLSLRLLDLGLVEPDRDRAARVRAAGKDNVRALLRTALVLLTLVVVGAASGAVAHAAVVPGAEGTVAPLRWTATVAAALLVVPAANVVQGRIWALREGRRRRQATARVVDDATRCRCWTTEAMHGTLARHYADQHLTTVPGGTSHAVAGALPAGTWVGRCEATARTWLVTTDPAGDVTLALGGPSGEAPPPRPSGGYL